MLNAQNEYQGMLENLNYYYYINITDYMAELLNLGPGCSGFDSHREHKRWREKTVLSLVRTLGTYLIV